MLRNIHGKLQYQQLQPATPLLLIVSFQYPYSYWYLRRRCSNFTKSCRKRCSLVLQHKWWSRVPMDVICYRTHLMMATDGLGVSAPGLVMTRPHHKPLPPRHAPRLPHRTRTTPSSPLYSSCWPAGQSHLELKNQIAKNLTIYIIKI